MSTITFRIVPLVAFTTLAIAANGIGTAPIGRPAEILVPAGTRFTGALQSEASTGTLSVGDQVEIRTTEAVVLDGATFPAGAVRLRGEVTESEGGDRVTGNQKLSIDFNHLELQGRGYPVSTELFRIKGSSETRKSVKQVVGGAVVGGVLGAITGNTRRGIVIGTAAGAGVAIATKGGHIVLPAGQRLAITLTEPVTVSYRSDVASR